MRSVIHLRLALGLLAIGSAVASPCKPISATTTSDAISAATSDASTKTSLVTSLASTTEDVSATSSAVVESSPETFALSAETSDASVTIETSVISDTTEFSTEATTAEPTTTAAETSTAGAPTFTMFASGSNSVTGRSLYSYNRDQTIVLFDPATEDDNPSIRQYSIGSQGRLVNDQGWFLCGYYGATNDELNKPATVVVCHDENLPQTAFLTCAVSGFEIQCEVPALACVSTGSPGMPATCVATPGSWSLVSVGTRPIGYTWQIGSSDTPAKYERMTMGIREV
ncbi:hypothetical protein IL306_013717 [Fusarium sp. DS 682]|nr:hypothetical protein IL306_013717 [Fusarium sp. DS 682]